MRDIRLRPRARRDLRDIVLYTIDTWGEDQAERYMKQLDAVLTRLASEPERGKPRQELRADLRSWPVGRHVIFYTHTASMLGVERVLHDQMDVDRHFPEEG